MKWIWVVVGMAVWVGVVAVGIARVGVAVGVAIGVETHGRASLQDRTTHPHAIHPHTPQHPCISIYPL